jgi:hypothetical protein
MDIYYKDLPLESPRDFLITDLINIADRDFKYFEKAVAPAIDSCKQKLDDLQNQIKLFIKKNHTDENGDIIPYHMSELGTLPFDRQHLENQLLSLIEMKVVYFYKTLENSIKDLMTLAYPDHYIPDTYKFYNVKNFFDFKNIKIANLTGYIEFDNIRKQNNNIKHHTSPDIDYLITVDDHNQYNYDYLNEVYDKNKDKAIIFIQSLKDLIIKDLFEISDEKLNEIAEQLTFKMSEESITKLISLLKN